MGATALYHRGAIANKVEDYRARQLMTPQDIENEKKYKESKFLEAMHTKDEPDSLMNAEDLENERLYKESQFMGAMHARRR